MLQMGCRSVVASGAASTKASMSAAVGAAPVASLWRRWAVASARRETCVLAESTASADDRMRETVRFMWSASSMVGRGGCGAVVLRWSGELVARGIKGGDRFAV